MKDRNLNKVVNELLDMFFISNKSSYLNLNITLAHFYRNLIYSIPDKDYEHIHEAFLV